MEATVKEIAAVLRSTESMAAQFAQRVQDRVGQPVSYAEILSAMQKISARSLSLEKVVAKVQQQQKKKAQASRRRATRSARSPSQSARRARSPSQSARPTSDASPRTTVSKQPKTILEKLEAVLQENWNRAEAGGLRPDRMSAQAFVKTVYKYTDRREATRRRILQAAQQLDQTDVLLTPALVADAAHKLFQG